MTTRHYDVVVLGRSLGALAAAAILARRDFRVLVLGQGQRPPSYRFDRHVLCRRPFTWLSAASPVFVRVFPELAQSPRMRRRVRMLDPMFGVVLADRRVEVPPDMEVFEREVEREFPEVRQLVQELYASFAQINETADEVFDRDLVWPPGTLWERLETGRGSASLPFVRQPVRQDLLGKFPSGHPFRSIVYTPAAFASDLAVSESTISPFALARIHGAWTRGVQALQRGEDEIAELILERVSALGGECLLEQRAEKIIVKRGRATGVLLDGSDEPIGATHILSDEPGEIVAELAGGEGITKQARSDWPRLTAHEGRFVASVVVNKRVLPRALAAESFLIPSRSGRTDPRKPVVHLQQLDPVEREPDANPDHALLVAETLLPRRGPLTALEAREAVLATLRESLPFFDEHVVLVDSTHDGLPLWDYSQGARREVDRIHVPETATRAEPMNWQWLVEPSGFLELAAEPVRGPIAGTFLTGRTVLPALGQEGELLAALSAARIITRSDKTRQRMRRHMWSKVDLQ